MQLPPFVFVELLRNLHKRLLIVKTANVALEDCFYFAVIISMKYKPINPAQVITIDNPYVIQKGSVRLLETRALHYY